MDDFPNNLSAEAALIGSVLYDNRCYSRVRDLVNPASFFAPPHVEIWTKIADLIEAGRVADGVTLVEAFTTSDRLQAIGGPNYLAQLLDSAAFGPEIEDYARMVADLSVRRDLVLAGRELSKSAFDQPAENVLDAHDASIELIRDKGGNDAPITSLKEVTLASLDNREALLEQLIPTGYPSIDNEIGGLEKGAMTVLGARPGMGKTAAAICLVGNMLRGGHTVGFFSLEMPDRDIGLRLGCWEAWNQNTGTVPYFSDVKQGRASESQLGRVMSALRQDHIDQMLVDDRGGLTINQMRRRIRDWKKQCRRRGRAMPSVIVVDHMGHARPDERCNGRYEKITEVSNQLLALSKEFDVAVLALCQLNREGAKNRRRPSLEDLRDSGAIEQDASLVLLLHREDYYLDKEAKEGVEGAADKLRSAKGDAECIIAKARNGPTGTSYLKHSIGHNVFRDPLWQAQRAAA